MENKISSELIYQGKIIDVYKDDVKIENGNIVKRELVKHPGGVCVALKNQEEKYAMVKQFRYGASLEMWEFPAGKLEKGEDPLTAILRETIEETGFELANIQDFGFMIPSGAYLSERIYLYAGDTGRYLGQSLDDDEDLQMQWFSLNELKVMIDNQIIIDAKTIVLVYKLCANSF